MGGQIFPTGTGGRQQVEVYGATRSTVSGVRITYSAAMLASVQTIQIPVGGATLDMQAVGGNIRYRVDGTAPTGTTGQQLKGNAATGKVLSLAAGTLVMLILETGSTPVFEGQLYV